MQERYIAAIDQGTTSTRCILFDHEGRTVSSAQLEHRQIFPRPGWVEHDPLEIWQKTNDVIRTTVQKSGVTAERIEALGITNQRETVVCWNRRTGKPYYNALVWQDTRTADIIDGLARTEGPDRFRKKTGLPLATYFSGSKMKWILDNVPEVRRKGEAGEAVFGTIDTYIIWQLTGGPGKGAFVTDVTNASRTLLMNLETLDWDDELLEAFTVPAAMLPEIRSSSAAEPYGYTTPEGPFSGRVPICGILGDQQAALFGQACFEKGTSKNTYGTGCFLLENTGENFVVSRHGLLTTVAYRVGREEPVYALEGSIAVAGALVQWVRDNLGLIEQSPEINDLAEKVEDSGGVYIVPAFSGLFAPYWHSDARGVITGLTGYVNKYHLARAVLEATAFQTRDIFAAMEKDSGITVTSLKVDGGMTASEILMQFQADILGVPVIRPRVTETTALGAAYAAGLSSGFWRDRAELATHWKEDKRWLPAMDEDEKKIKMEFWRKAVQRTMDWL